MTEATVVHTNLPASTYAGTVLGLQINRSLKNPPDVAILFISPVYHANELLQAFQQTCQPRLLIGCSASGEFTSNTGGLGFASAVALRSTDMRFSAGIGYGLSKNGDKAAQQLFASFRGKDDPHYQFRSAILLLDILGGSVNAFFQQLTKLTNQSYQFFGGGASDNHTLTHTPVFYGTQVYNDAVVGLEILSNKPIGIGVHQDWQPASGAMLVTATQGQHIISIDYQPALNVIQQYAEETGQPFVQENPVPFFLQNPIGVAEQGSPASAYKLHIPLSATPNGSLFCPVDIPAGSTIHLMRHHPPSLLTSTERAVQDARARLQGHQPALALFFHYPASRAHMKNDYALTLQAMQDVLPHPPYLGCQLYGQFTYTINESSTASQNSCTYTPAVCLIPH